MELDFALLAERAELTADRMFMYGAGWVAVEVPSLPWPTSLALVARFVGTTEEAGERGDLLVTLEPPSGADPTILGLFPITLPTEASEESRILVANWLLEVTNIPLPEEGWYTFQLALDGEAVKRIAFRLRVRTDPADEQAGDA